MLQGRYLCMVMAMVMVVIFGLFYTTRWMSYTKVRILQNEDLLASCPLQKIDLFDARVMEHIGGIDPPVCPKLQETLLNFTSDGRVTFLKVNTSTTHCYYQEVMRIPNNDFGVIFLKKEQLYDGIIIPHNVTVITCIEGNRTIYENVKIFVHKRKGTIASPPQTPNVFLFGIDSLSGKNSLRQLPNLNGFMKSVLKAHFMKYQVKVGENTRPNILALTTGRQDSQGSHNQTLCDKNCERPEFFDDRPFIWKYFAEMGYTTAMGEGRRKIEGAFNYMRKGFRHVPTNHYIRPYYLALKRLSKKGLIAKKRPITCTMEQKPLYYALVEWAEALITTYAGTPLFLMTLSGYTHNFLSEFQLLDEPYTRMLRSLHKKNLLNNTIVICYGDHGVRAGPFRKTWMGRIEDDMPYLSVSLPFWMRTEPFHFEESLTFNEGSITTLFDVHATLKDVVKKRFYSGKSVFHENKERGLSLFKKIPRSRTCPEAGVPDVFCPCFKEVNVSEISPEIIRAARDVEVYINQELLKGKTMCAEVHSPDVGNIVRVYIQGDTESRKKEYSAGLRMDVTLQPSNGVFDCNFVYDTSQKKYEISGIIQRKDIYGEQGKCVQDPFLEKYCHCKKNLIM